MLVYAQKFFETVLPSIDEAQPAFLNLHWSSIGTDGKKYWSGRATLNVGELKKTTDWALKGDQKDLYVCMSSQGRCEDKISKKGMKYKSALRFSNDAIALRSIYIDIDVKTEKKKEGYNTTEDAIAALQGFVTSQSIPEPSAVVASGSGGFHAHWAMDRNMTRQEWQHMANAFAAMALASGIIFDSQCTVDAARILRIPGTLNHKTSPPNMVKLLSCGDQISYELMFNSLKPFFGALPPPATATPSDMGGANDDLGSNLEIKHREILIEEVARVCPFIQRTLGTGGKDNSNPLWFITASISAAVVDGRAAFHAMSDKHASYVPTEADALFDRMAESKKRRNLGWTQCDKIASYGCPECATCPLLLKHKSPLNFVVTIENDAPDATLPDRYVRNSDGVIMFRSIDEAGQPITFPISPYPMVNGWLSNNPWTFHFTTRLETGKRAMVEIPCEVITAKDSLAKYLGACGFFCSEKEYKIIKEFLVSWIRKLQLTKDSVIGAKPFGWSVVDGNIDGFAYGGRIWTVGDDKPAANPDPVLTYQYTPKGTHAPWQEVSDILCASARPSIHLLLASAFAGPLVRFTGYDGLVLNGYSTESGVGKTTAVKLAQAVWGHPVSSMQGLNDTPLSVIKKMGKIVNLPIYWDEFKDATQVKRFCNIVFDITGGREKSRLNPDSTLQVAGTWQTIMTSTTNDSLVDPMAREAGSTLAGLYRLFEFVVPPSEIAIDGKDSAAVQRAIGRLNDNYGHAGLVFSKFLGAHHKRIADDVAKMQDDLHNEFTFKQDERFWHGTMTTNLMGATYSNELGLTRIDVLALKDFMATILTRMRALVVESPTDMSADISVLTILAEFLNTHRARSTLITNRIWKTRGSPPMGAVTVQGNPPTDDLRIHIGRDDKLIRFSSTYFSKWIQDQGHSRIAWTNKMKAEFGLASINGRLGGGTTIAATATEHLIELDMNHTKLSQFVE